MPALSKRMKIALGVIAGLFVLYSLAGFVAAPLVIRRVLENSVSQTLKRQVSVNLVRVNPYTLSLTLGGLSIADNAATSLATLHQIKVNAQISSVFKKALILKSVVLDIPHINIIRSATDRFNFSDLLEPRTDGSPESPQAPAEAPRVVLGQLHVTQGSLRFEDQTLEAPFSTRISDMTLSVTSLDTAPQAPPATFAFSGETEPHETLRLRGRLAPVPLTATIELDARAIALAKYTPYYRPFWNADIQQGHLDLRTTGHWSGKEGRFKKTSLKVMDLQINRDDDGTPLLNMPLFQVDDAEADLQAHTLDLGHVSSRNGSAWVSRTQEGRLNWAAALAHGVSPARTQPAPPAPAPAPDAAPSPVSSDWTVTVPELSVDNFRLEITDHRLTGPAKLTLANLELNTKSLSTQPDDRGEVALSLTWNDQGSLTVTGQLGLVPVSADLGLTADRLDLRPLQPYVSEHVGLVITSGQFNTQGDLHLGMPPDAPLEMRYEGQVSAVNFESIDSVNQADFFNFQSLFLNKLKLETQPLHLSVEEVALTDFYNKVLIATDGTSNIGTIFGGGESGENQDTTADASPEDGSDKPNEKPDKSKEELAEPGAPAGGEESAPMSIQIKRVTLQGGSIDFTDVHVDPSVRLPMEKVGGRISGLDAITENKADVLLEGRVYGNVPMKISGKINPLISPPYVDLQLNLASADLTPFAPYAEKYLGYKLNKGLLSMNLSYLVKEKRLQGENNAVLTQLTLGESVPSPSATSLPIKLAIALLKDRQGNIDIDLPVKGNLDDPEFSIGGIVLQMLGNLIVDIVTSPFKMLGALFGGGEELSYLDFAAGVSELSPENKAKLDNLAKILFERPELNLEIQGQFDRDADTLGLRKIRFDGWF